MVQHWMLDQVRCWINNVFHQQDAFTIILSTAFTIFVLYAISKMYPIVRRYGLVGALQLLFLSTLKRVPGGKGLIDSELQKARDDLKRELKAPKSKHAVYHKLPEEGVSRQLIREEMLFQLDQEKTMRNKRGHGGMYVMVHEKYNKFVSESGAERERMSKIMDSNFSVKEEAYLYFSHTNMLYPDLFPGIHKFELEIISMTASMLHAPEPAGLSLMNLPFSNHVIHQILI